jgi:Putative prokaryotic signal transducing protein
MAGELVTIAEYMDSIQAEMAKQVLADFGIKSTLAGQYGADVLAGVLAFATVKLQVLEKDADEAKQILEDQEQGFKPGEFSEFNELGGYEEPEEQ